LRGGTAGAGVPGLDRQVVRGGRRDRATGGEVMTRAALAVRHELIGLLGVVERNSYLVKRYAVWELTWFVWTVANTLTIIFIAKGVEAAGGSLDVKRETTVLLIGAVIWSYVGVLFELLTQPVGCER